MEGTDKCPPERTLDEQKWWSRLLPLLTTWEPRAADWSGLFLRRLRRSVASVKQLGTRVRVFDSRQRVAECLLKESVSQS